MPTTIIILIGTAVIVAITSLLGASDTLPSNIRTALASVQREDQVGLIACIFGPPTGAARGIQIVLLCLLVGGVPSAVLAATLNRSRTAARPVHCANVFLAGFVFQLSSLVFTLFLLILLMSAASAFVNDRLTLVLIGAALMSSSACSAWGVGSWRALQMQVRETQTILGRI